MAKKYKFKKGDIGIYRLHDVISIIIIKDYKKSVSSETLGKSYGGFFDFYKVEYVNFDPKLTMWELSRYIDNFYHPMTDSDKGWIRLLYA